MKFFAVILLLLSISLFACNKVVGTSVDATGALLEDALEDALSLSVDSTGVDAPAASTEDGAPASADVTSVVD